MQEFYIDSGSMLPVLKMELVKDGRHSFRKFCDEIQNASVTFSMKELKTGINKIVNAPCGIELKDSDEDGCEDEYLIVYKWKKRDTNERGSYIGTFEITFGDDLTSQDGLTYSSGNLIVPIREDVEIIIK